jgi:hypothetical protein
LDGCAKKNAKGQTPRKRTRAKSKRNVAERSRMAFSASRWGVVEGLRVVGLDASPVRVRRRL